jgi:predicted Holliday junction resolvase-like endonuclease
MNKIAVISLLLISILLSSIILTSISNIDKFIVSLELAEEDVSNKNKTNSNNPNLLEEEEKHLSHKGLLEAYVYKIKEVKRLCSSQKTTSVFIEIVTPPPLG